MNQRNFLTIALIFFCFLNVISLVASIPDDCSEDLIATELILVCDFYTDSAQPIPPGSCDESSVVINNGTGCNSRMLMKVFVANLIGFNVSPLMNSSHSLPAIMPDMYVEYDSNQDGVYDTKIGPFRDFDFKGIVVPSGAVGMNHYIFEHELVLNHDFDNYCGSSSSHYINGKIMVRLLEYTNGQFELYDLKPFSGLEEEFSCEVFHETNVCCRPSQPLLCDPLPTEYLPFSCVDCDTPCEAARSSKQLSTGIIDERLTLQKISPNPFEDWVEVVYRTDEELPVFIEVIDTKGSVLHSRLLSASLGEQSLSLDLSDLPVGVYYCRLRIGDKVETMKLLKLKS